MTRKKILKVTFILLAVFFGLLLIVVADALIKTNFVNGKPVPTPATKLVVASPVNLDQIVGISKFRSCQGHDNSGKGPEGIVENNRSMKHYFAPPASIREQLGVIEIFAPFDGKIVHRFPGSHGSEIMIAPEADRSWAMIVFHIDLLPGYDLGKQVMAGELIGHANVKGRHDFDIGFAYADRSLLIENVLAVFTGSPHFMLPKSSYLTSVFDHMAPEVLAQFKQAGFNTDNMQYSREFRDANKCDFDNAAYIPGDWQYLPGHDPMKQGEQNTIPPEPVRQP